MGAGGGWGWNRVTDDGTGSCCSAASIMETFRAQLGKTLSTLVGIWC